MRGGGELVRLERGERSGGEEEGVAIVDKCWVWYGYWIVWREADTGC